MALKPKSQVHRLGQCFLTSDKETYQLKVYHNEKYRHKLELYQILGEG